MTIARAGDCTDASGAWLEALDADRSLKWVSPAHMHLTLAFLGEMAEPAVPADRATLSR